MKVFYDKEKTKEIEEKLWNVWNKKEKQWAEKGYNCSECTYCEMKCYNRRIDLEAKPTKKTIGFLVFGIISEFVVMSIYPEEQQQFEANLNELVWGHLDVYEDLEHPIEGKATAKRIFKRDQLPLNWVTQLINYMTMTNSSKGWIYILNIFTRLFSAWCIELIPQDRLDQSIVLMDKVTRFDYAIPNRDPSNLNISPEEYDLCHYKKTCPRRQECKEKHREMNKK